MKTTTLILSIAATVSAAYTQEPEVVVSRSGQLVIFAGSARPALIVQRAADNAIITERSHAPINILNPRKLDE